jgi:hypothetical protein
MKVANISHHHQMNTLFEHGKLATLSNTKPIGRLAAYHRAIGAIIQPSLSPAVRTDLY